MEDGLTAKKRIVREIAGIMKGTCNVKYPNISFVSINVVYEISILRSRRLPSSLVKVLLLKTGICDA